MKIIQILLAISTIVFAGAMFLKILPFAICSLGIFASNAILYSVRSIEYKKNGDNNGFFLSLITAIISYMVVINMIF